MQTEDNKYLIKHIIKLRQIHNFALRTTLRKLNTLIAIHHATDSFSIEDQIRLQPKVAKLLKDISLLEKTNEKINTRLFRLKQTLNIITDQ